MSTDTDTASACSHCGFPLPKHGGGLRHYGTHTAHQESECLNLLRAHIRSIATERDALARERDALLAKVAEQDATLKLQQDSYEREIRIEVEAERKACETLCEEIADGYQAREAYRWPEMKTDAQTGAHDCAAGIRARATPKEPT